MENEIIRKGFIAPEIEPDHYVTGALSPLPQIELQPDRNWKPFLVKSESQISPIFGDTFNCSAFGSLDAIEILARRKFGVELNWSDRALGIMAGTYPPGNDVHVVCETIRKLGVVPEDMLPFDQTLPTVDAYYSPRRLPDTFIKEGVLFIQGYEYGHEWLFNDPRTPLATKQQFLLDALKTSPLSVSVVGWRYRNGKYYKYPGEPDNHWVALINAVPGQYWEIFDSADSFVKQLEWDYDFGYVKRHTLEKRTTPIQQKLGLLARLQEALKELFGMGVKTAEVTPPKPVEAAATSEEAPRYNYLWDTPENARHSVRVLCDEMGLSHQNKEIITACIMQESGFKNTARGVNKNKMGDLLSTDWGICQINDYWNIGPGKPFASVKEVLDNPDKAVRFMVKMLKTGHLDLWASYKSKAYLKYLK